MRQNRTWEKSLASILGRILTARKVVLTILGLVMVVSMLFSRVPNGSASAVSPGAPALVSTPVADSPPLTAPLAETSPPFSVYCQAPLPAAQVAVGKVPPVNQRPPDDPEKQNNLTGRIIDIAADQLQLIGIHLPPLTRGVVKPDFHNVPPLMSSSACYPQPAPTNPCHDDIQQP